MFITFYKFYATDILVVANSKEEAEYKVSNMDWACLMWAIATEVGVVNGYKIVLEKV